MCCVWTNGQHYIFHHNNQPFAIVIETVNEFARVEFDRTEKYFDGLKSSKCVKPAQIKQPFQPTTHNNNFHLVLMRFKLTANNHLRLKAFLAQFLNRNSYQRLLIVTKMHSMCTYITSRQIPPPPSVALLYFEQVWPTRGHWPHTSNIQGSTIIMW